MTTREALIAAIAATPDDDLPRLVAADWFEENGEPERAEFIRRQLDDATRPGHPRLRWSCPRLDELVCGHALQWFAPLVQSLDPTTSLDAGYRPSNSNPSHTIVSWSDFPSDRDAFALLVVVKRGFAERLWLNLDRLPEGCDVTEAMKLEPIRMLIAELPPDENTWNRFTRPSLSRLHELALYEQTNGGQPTSMPRIFHDPNLSRVRHLTLQDSRSRSRPLGGEVMEELARSYLGERVEELAVRTTNDGLRVLASADKWRFTALELFGPITQEALPTFGEAAFALLLNRLKLPMDLNDAGLAAVARCHTFPKLVDLELRVSYDATVEGMAALATAEFIPRLERLSLLTDSIREWELLHPLLEALHPQTLRELHLPLWREREGSDYVRQRFGPAIRFR